MGTPHPFLGYLGSLSNGKYFPSAVAPFWNDYERRLLCSSCHRLRIFPAHVSNSCDNCFGMNIDHSLVRVNNSEEEEDSVDEDRVKGEDNDSDHDEDCVQVDSDARLENNIRDDESSPDDETVSVCEFDDDINVVNRDINGDQCHFFFALH